MHTHAPGYYDAQDLARFPGIGKDAPELAEKFFAGTTPSSPRAR
jgi:hypothetical protein